MQPFTKLRLRLRHAGYEPVPLIGKAPKFDNWQKIAQDSTDFTIINWEATFPAFENTGGLTRLMPALDIDLLNQDAAEDVENLAKDRFGDRGEILVRIGLSPKRAMLFQTDVPFKKIVQNFALTAVGAKAEKLEVLSEGQQLALFGIHPDTHRCYKWIGDRSPDNIARQYLPKVTELELATFVSDATQLVVTRYGYRLPPGPGAAASGDQQWSRKFWHDLLEVIATGASGLHDAIRDVAGKLVAKGWARQDVEDFLLAHMDATSGPKDKRWAEYRHGVSRAIDGAFAKGFHQKSNAGGGAGYSWDEPDDSVLVDRRGDLPELPLDLLPPRLARWCEEAALATGTTAAHVFLPAIGIASGLIGTSRTVRAARSYVQPLAMWTMLVAPSASGKTPALRASKAALDGVAKELAAQNDIAKKEHDEKQAAAEASLANWKSAMKAATKAGEPRPPMPPEAAAPKMFVPATAYVTDATIEKIGILHTERPHGLLLVMDELAGLFSNDGRYGRGSDVEFWLAAHNGDGHRVDRVMRDSLYIPHLMMGIVGGIQPDVLAQAFDGPRNGFSARFLYAYPSIPPYRPLADITGDRSAVFRRAIKRLAGLTMEREEAGDDLVPVEVPLSQHARAELEHLRREMHEGRLLLSDHEREWFGKADMHALRLAGVLAFLDWALSEEMPPGHRFQDFDGVDPPPPPEPVEITGEQMALAVRLITEFFWPHARAVLRHIGTTEAADARIVLRWLQAEVRAGRSVVSQRNIQREALSQRLDSDAVVELLANLATAGWLRRYVPPANRQGGRPALLWEVNPRLGILPW